ncbi:unnamed protein product, partial [Ilex paraguariensis]
ESLHWSLTISWYVPWCSVNPYPSPENKEKEVSKFPLFFEGPKPFEVTVNAGDPLPVSFLLSMIQLVLCIRGSH